MHDGRIIDDGSPGDVLREDTIARVYGVAVRVLRHPDTGRPVVVPTAAAQTQTMSAITG
jgi:iron complex transport system ATP-binding protein